MKLLVIILNYKTTELTIDCLQSLEPELAMFPGAAVTVVENGSGDGAERQLRDAIAARGWNSWVQLISLNRNTGFTAGNNLVIRSAIESSDPPDYFLLLNSDTVALPGAVDVLVRSLEERPHTGIAGSRLEYPTGEVQSSPFRFHGIVSELERGLTIGAFSRIVAGRTMYRPKPECATRVDWVAGAAMLLRRRMVASIGLFDVGFFAYFEDMDYCLTASRHGWETWYIPESRVVHIEGASSKIRSGPYRSPPAYWFEARRWYFQKNHGVVYMMVVDAMFIMACTAGYIYSVLRRRQASASFDKLKDAVQQSVFAAGLR